MPGVDRLYCQRCGNLTELRTVEGIDRPVCTVCGTVTYLDPKLAVAVVIERDGKLLFGKRGAHTREPGKWSFPAGFVERGEQIEAAAKREAKEEIGLDVEIRQLLGLYSSPGEIVVLAVYVATVGEGDAVAADDLTEVAWFSPDDLPPLAFAHDRRIIEAWRKTIA
jgi:ADP-ribose pyrophosphatase YjhB (NUDIX family)